MRWPRALRPDWGLVLVVLGCITLLVMVSLHSKQSTCPAAEQPSAREAWPTAPASTRARPRPVPPCPANTSMTTHPDWESQPAQVRNFLLYRHCRTFRLLQDTPASKCAQPVFLLLAIKSSPGNYERRELVRRTWGRERLVRGAQLRLIFLVGTSASPHEARKVNRLLALEAETHGDILQWDFHDTFFNLTLKQVLFLEWQTSRCTNASFVLNGDDDVFAHTDNMVAYLQSQQPDHHLFVGQLIQNVGPIRASGSKYYVPKLVMAGDRYPPYCGGGGFLLSRFTAAALRRAAPALELFPIDDVFLGMCLEREGLKPAAHSGVRTSGVHAPSASMSSFDPCFYRELLLVHRFLPYELLLMWEALNQPDLVCGQRRQVY